MVPLNVNVVRWIKAYRWNWWTRESRGRGQENSKCGSVLYSENGENNGAIHSFGEARNFPCRWNSIFAIFGMECFSSDEKTVRDETMTKLVKVMQMQGAVSFAPIIQHPSNITTIAGWGIKFCFEQRILFRCILGGVWGCLSHTLRGIPFYQAGSSPPSRGSSPLSRGSNPPAMGSSHLSRRV